MDFTAASVIALATDDASVKAAKGLMSLSKWGTSLGSTERSTWGECQGSGSKPYQTQVDHSGASPTFKCSCPSRKFPCKHGLALLLLKADQGKLFKINVEPPWVSEWVDTRQSKAIKKQEQVELALSDPAVAATAAAAAAKRIKARWQKIDAGAADLEKFLCDQIGRGLAGMTREQIESWRTMAARMVDAQAPGWGLALQRATIHINAGPIWHAQVLEAMGCLQMGVDAVRRRDTLPEALQADLQVSLGWPLDKDDVLRRGERMTDSWWVVGSITEERENNLRERRVWLVGAETGRRALILDHSHGGKGFEVHWPPGRCVRTELAFFPSAWPQRATPTGPLIDVQASGWCGHAVQDEWALVSEQVAQNPFSSLSLMIFSDATPVHTVEGADIRWWLKLDDSKDSTDSIRTIPLNIGNDQGWDLMANSAGASVSMAGEWDGRALRPTLAPSPEGMLTFQNDVSEQAGT